MRCQDDKGDYSNIIYLYTSRNNHPPTCHIFVPQGPQWCLPDTSDFWHGIRISWEGKDSLDYTGFIQPDFLWETRVYGPFADSISADTLSQYLYNLTDPQTGDTLTSLEEWTFRDLRTGWYLIYSVNFDDAFVPAVEPAVGIFEVYEPQWIRHNDYIPILIVDNNRYFPAPRFGELTSIYEDSVNQFFDAAMGAAGYSQDDYDWFDANDEDPVLLDISVLYNYRLVIVSDIDYTVKLSTTQQEQYADYLNVGGMLWITGRRSFVSSSIDSLVEFGSTSEDILPYSYLDLSSTYEATLLLRDAAEFSGANPIISGFPILEVDTLRVSYTSWPANHYAEALLGVGFSVRNENSETIYTYNSIFPNSSSFHGFPVATRYDSGVFKTSYFSFPLYFIKEPQAFLAMEEMLTWFFEE